MARAGIGIRLGEGPLAFAARAKAHSPELSDSIDAVTQSYLKLGYQPAPSDRDLKTLKKALRF